MEVLLVIPEVNQVRYTKLVTKLYYRSNFDTMLKYVVQEYSKVGAIVIYRLTSHSKAA